MELPKTGFSINICWDRRALLCSAFKPESTVRKKPKEKKEKAEETRKRGKISS